MAGGEREIRWPNRRYRKQPMVKPESEILKSMQELPSDLDHPSLCPSVDSLLAHFERVAGRPRTPLRNPHREIPVSDEVRRNARPSAVLLPIVTHEERLTILLTRRHEDISYAGHLCFPGGRCDSQDRDATATALRETHEEIGLPAADVRVIGQLGDYVSQTGYRISTVIGLVEPPLRLTPRPGEVEEILEIPLSFALRSDSYRLASRDPDSGSAIYFLQHGEAIVTGPTISLLIGFYEELLETGTGLTSPGDGQSGRRR